jgi:hypothetical protein
MYALTPSDMEWLLARNSGEPGIWLLTIDGPELGGVLRYARNTTDIVSRGLLFQRSWWDRDEAADTTELPRYRIQFPNVMRDIGLALEEMSSGLTFSFELVRQSDLDRPLVSHRAWRLESVTIDPLVISGELRTARFENEPYAPLAIVPSKFPGLF